MDDGEEEIVEFCRRVQPRLTSTVALHCGRVDLAEDGAQEALARAWQRIKRVLPSDPTVVTPGHDAVFYFAYSSSDGSTCPAQLAHVTFKLRDLRLAPADGTHGGFCSHQQVEISPIGPALDPLYGPDFQPEAAFTNKPAGDGDEGGKSRGEPRRSGGGQAPMAAPHGDSLERWLEGLRGSS